MAKKNRDKDKSEKPKVAKELDGLELNVDSFGEIRKSMSIDDINAFLNEKVDDKKLRDRKDLPNKASNKKNKGK